MATHKPFRELIPPGSNFEFIGRTRLWVLISFFLIGGSIAMLFVNQAMRGEMLNWSIDFKGGTEIVLSFQKDGSPTEVPAGDVRAALEKAGYDGFAVSDFHWDVDDPATGKVRSVTGMRVTMLEYGAVSPEQQQKINADLQKVFGAALEGASWSGDRVFLRTTRPVTFAELREVFTRYALELREWEPTVAQGFAIADQATGEYRSYASVRGIDAQVEKLLESEVGADVITEQTYGVGPKAGSELRDDGIKALFFAMGLIMLYLAFRFDVRYAPGAVVALLHDAILVIGAFAITWQEVSLTTVAALLTVIGYSVNDTVIIFDRIRENVGRLKDKKLPRIINISINETLGRSILTSSTVFLTTLMMNIFGTGLVRNFAFAMNVGVVVGTYSTVFIASPVMLWIHNRWYSTPASAKPGARRRPEREEPIEDGVAEEPEGMDDDEESADSGEHAAASAAKPGKKLKKRKR
jgi:preprotein translocase subunit SecF